MELVAPVSYHKCWPVCAMFGLAVHLFVMGKKYLGWTHTRYIYRFGDRNSESGTDVFFFFFKCFKHTTMKFNHITGNRMLCMVKANKYGFTPRPPESWCVRSGWHTVGLERTAAEESSHSQCLCRLFLFPLGIPANLHLCQLDVADGIGVWKTKTGKG